MYRIEIKPGEENVFRTIEELATGIRNGLITPRARIFHNASQKWLPIEFHPHYKKALQLPRTKSGERPAVVVASVPPKTHEPAPVPASARTPSHSAGRTHAVLAPVVASPVAVPPVVEAPGMERPVIVSPAMVSPVVELPTIDYPESTPVESLLPVAHAPKGRGTGRLRPVVLGTAVAVVIGGLYVALSGAMPTHEAAADSRPTAGIAKTTSEPAPPVAEAPAPTRDSLPRGPVVTRPSLATGPTFGPSATPPVPPKRQIVSIGASTTAPVTKDSAASIEPAPVDMDVSLPSLPAGDSLAPGVATDSNAIRRILRAVGGKAGPAPRP